jgi:hypothetical protein
MTALEKSGVMGKVADEDEDEIDEVTEENPKN